MPTYGRPFNSCTLAVIVGLLGPAVACVRPDNRTDAPTGGLVAVESPRTVRQDTTPDDSSGAIFLDNATQPGALPCESPPDRTAICASDQFSGPRDDHGYRGLAWTLLASRGDSLTLFAVSDSGSFTAVSVVSPGIRRVWHEFVANSANFARFRAPHDGAYTLEISDDHQQEVVRTTIRATVAVAGSPKALRVFTASVYGDHGGDVIVIPARLQDRPKAELARHWTVQAGDVHFISALGDEPLVMCMLPKCSQFTPVSVHPVDLISTP